jgi:hypothetical protein
MRSAVKELRKVIADGDKSKAEELLPGTLSLEVPLPGRHGGRPLRASQY